MRVWLENLFENEERIGIPWHAAWAFPRITTNPRVFELPLSAEQALGVLDDRFALPNVIVIIPEGRHLLRLRPMMIEGQATGTHVTDAALAAIAIEQGATLASTDRDFARYPNIKWINPLA